MKRLALVALACVACNRAQPEPQRPTYGAVMADVARRFELVGKAASAGRFELAQYEVSEIGEQFLVLPRAVPPKEGHPETIPPLETEFVKTALPDLRQALDAKDRAKAAAAFERTARACNGCHQASGHGFVEVPTLPGHSVPNVDPVAP